MKTQIKLSDHFTYPRLLRFCLSPMIMMVFTSIYGVVDGLFVSNFAGKTAFAAINLVMPFTMIFGGVGFMFGTGGSALVAKTLGERKPELANRYFSMMVEASLISGAVISVVGVALMEPIARFLGASDEMLPYCVTYGRIVIAFNVSFMLQNLFQSFLITAEKPKLGLYVTVAAGLTNMVLDALFVAVFRWGVAGAAIATGISQCVGGVLPFLYLCRPNSSLLQFKPTSIEAKPVLLAAGNGFSEVISSVTSSVVGMLYNMQLLAYAGENGVAAYGAIMYVDFVFMALFIGYSIGSAPIVGYHYGAMNTKELNNLLTKSIKLMVGGGVAVFLAGQALASPLSHIFVGYDQELMEMTVHGFRVYCFMYLVAGFNIYSSSFFTALNNGTVSAAISFLRTFVFKLSAVLLLPKLLGLDGIWLATIVAEVCSCALSLAFLIGQRKRYNYF